MATTAVIGIEVRDYMIDEEMGIVNKDKQLSDAKAQLSAKITLLKQKKDELKEKEKSLASLIATNQKLRSDIKLVSLNLDKTISETKAKLKKEEAKSSMVTDTKFGSKEIDSASKEIKKYQREIISLKQKLETSAAYDKYNDLENKYRESEGKYKELQKELSTLKHILEEHQKVIHSYPKTDVQYNTQITPAKEKLKTIDEEVKKLKDEAKKQHNQIQDLECKYRKTLEELNRKPAQKEDDDSNEENKKTKEEYDSTKKEQTKFINEFAVKIKGKQKKKSEYEAKLKEIRKELQLSLEKVAQLQSMRKSIKLNPLNNSNSHIADQTNSQPNITTLNTSDHQINHTIEDKRPSVPPLHKELAIADYIKLPDKKEESPKKKPAIIKQSSETHLPIIPHEESPKHNTYSDFNSIEKKVEAPQVQA